MILCTNPELADLWDRMLVVHSKLPDDDLLLSLSRPEQVFYLVFWWDCELQNGGFGQFIGNESGNLYLETIDALLAIGSMRSAVWMSYIQDEAGITFNKVRSERYKQGGYSDISEIETIAERAAARVASEYGEWMVKKTEPEDMGEDEFNLLNYVRKHMIGSNWSR